MVLLVGTSKWLNVVQLLFRVKKLFAATPTPTTGTVGTQTPVTTDTVIAHPRGG